MEPFRTRDQASAQVRYAPSVFGGTARLADDARIVAVKVNGPRSVLLTLGGPAFDKRAPMRTELLWVLLPQSSSARSAHCPHRHGSRPTPIVARVVAKKNLGSELEVELTLSPGSAVTAWVGSCGPGSLVELLRSSCPPDVH